MQRGGTVGPIGFAADQAHEDSARLRQRAFDIGVDRERMAERDQVCKPERGQAGAASAPACGEGGEIAVGEREHHEVGRILTEIDGRRGLLQAMALAADDVHRFPYPEIPNPALIAASSISPCSPITTSLDRPDIAPHGWSTS